MATNKRVVSVSVKRRRDPHKQRQAISIQTAARAVEAAVAAMTDGVVLSRITPTLISCIKERVDVVRAVYPNVHDSEWGDGHRDADAIAVVHGDLVNYAESIEYVRGVADAYDVTPLTLIDTLGI